MEAGLREFDRVCMHGLGTFGQRLHVGRPDLLPDSVCHSASPCTWCGWDGPPAMRRPGSLRSSLGVAAILFTELHADTGGALTIGTARCHPDDLGCHWQTLRRIHELQ